MPHQSIAEADRYCQSLLRGHYENFWVRSPLVGRRLRPHIARIYAYCRTVDDLGDESRSRDDALARLAILRQDLEHLFAGGTPAHPVLMALAASIRERRLPAQPFFDLIAANVQDQQTSRYQSWPELLGYCQLSAATVGRMVLAVAGYDDPRLTRLSDDVCIGLQLANFAQDVKVDAGRGRVYLLQTDLAELGDQGAVQAMCERARSLLASGVKLEMAVGGWFGSQLALYRLGGEAIVGAVARTGYRTAQIRPALSMTSKVQLLARVLIPARANGPSPTEQET
jgi:squalene synthase HpnC